MQMRQHPAAAVDLDFELIALEETRFSSQAFDLAANYPPGSISRWIVRWSVLRRE